MYYFSETTLVSMVELSDEDGAGETEAACPIANILMQCTILYERVDRAGPMGNRSFRRKKQCKIYFGLVHFCFPCSRKLGGFVFHDSFFVSFSLHETRIGVHGCVLMTGT